MARIALAALPPRLRERLEAGDQDAEAEIRDLASLLGTQKPHLTARASAISRD